MASGQSFALKKIVCQTEEHREVAAREIQTYQLGIDGVAELLDHGVNRESDILLLLPLFESNWANLMPATPSSCEQHVRIALAMAQALHCMHSEFSLAHRDIKPENVLVNSDGSARLIDLGSVCSIPQTVSSRNHALQIQDEVQRNCSIFYLAPELVEIDHRAPPLTAATDIWSFGCCCYAVMSGNSPFFDATGQNSAELAILNCSIPKVPPDFESPPWEPFREIVSHTLISQPEERWTAGQIVNHLKKK